MLDLNKFCAPDPAFLSESRLWLAKPFSKGEWTYATDGRILIRVPRRDDVPEVPAVSEQAWRLFDEVSGEPFFKAPKINVPEIDEDVECLECEDGHLHDCPDCKCVCPDCEGTGIERPWHDLSYGYGEAIFNGRYIIRIASLPDLEFGKPDREKPMRFRFAGGEGLIMPMRGKCGDHIDLSLEQAA